MKSELIKRRITKLGVIMAVIVAVIAFCVYVARGPMVLLMFPPVILEVLFPILVFLPVPAILLLISVGLGAITIWAFRRGDLKRVLSTWSVLALIAFAAAISMVFFPTLKVIFTSVWLLPGESLLSIWFLPGAFLLSIFTGLGAMVISLSYRQDLRQVLKLIKFTFKAIVLSTFLWTGLYVMPRILMFLAAGLILVYLYWPGKKRGFFPKVLGPVFALELALLLTINLIIL
jgi:hypothetical protein